MGNERAHLYLIVRIGRIVLEAGDIAYRRCSAGGDAVSIRFAEFNLSVHNEFQGNVRGPFSCIHIQILHLWASGHAEGHTTAFFYKDEPIVAIGLRLWIDAVTVDIGRFCILNDRAALLRPHRCYVGDL